jgi:capsular exopolysaccharide synthesis family protein
MNRAANTIDIELPPTIHISSTEPPPAKPGSGLVVHYYRDGEFLKDREGGRINPRLVCLLQPKSTLAESYFRLRHTLEQMHSAERGIVVGVTSPGKGDGKTLTAINLASALAQDAHARVLLVDLNLRPSGSNVGKYFGLQADAESGVADWIGNEECGKGLASYHLPGFNLYLIPSGTSAESPYELLKSLRLDELFQQARQRYDYVIVDTPQTLLLPDIELIARVVDGFLVVVRADSTPQEKLEEALNLMTQEKVLGLVFNASPAHR